MVGLMVLAVLLAVLPLFLILGTLIVKGAGSLSLAFFTRMPVPAGETGGGVAHAIVGTLTDRGTGQCSSGSRSASARGSYLRRVSRHPARQVTRFVADVLNGTPSIVVGVFAWTLIVARPEALLGPRRELSRWRC